MSQAAPAPRSAQATAAPPRPAVQTPASAPAPAAPVATPTAAPASSRTPQRLRALNTAVLWLGVAFGVAGAVSFVLLALALGRAGDSTAQLIRVQQIQTNLLAADATATNAFLVGGLEPPAQRAAYDKAIDTASTLIAQAGRAEPADEQALSVLNEQLVAYSSAIEQARANNRQGFPVGAQYLRTASATLRAEALPVLDNLVRANSERAAGQMDTDEGWLFGLVGFFTLAGLALIQIWLARRFRRTLNPALVAATAVGLVVWIGVLIAVDNVSGSVRAVRSGSFADVNDVSTARIRGFDAKSNESLTLIARGSGGSFEKAWAASSATVTARVRFDFPALARAWEGYTAVHTQVRALDDGGKWDQAVVLATSTAKGSANATFAAFDEQSAFVVNTRGAEATAVLRGHRTGLVLAAAITFLAGIAVALIGRRGIAARLREYR